MTHPGKEVAIIQTPLGELVVAFWQDEAPNTVENFKSLARRGFYDGTCFHRIMSDFMIQGGDPLTKDLDQKPLWGTGDPGYALKEEFNDRPHVRGVISMARGEDPDSAGCQFFICLADARFLDGNYTAFGELIQGDDVLEAIGDTPVEAAPDGEMSRPTQRIEVERVRIAPASAFL